MRAVVMAGGEGSRLRPLTSRLPKPLVPVANKPVMEHILDLLRRHGITEVVATLHYLADEIESYFGNGADFGVNLQYVVEDMPLGTAGAVKLAHDMLAGEPFVVVSGDALTDIDLGALIASHRDRNSDATIALQRVATPLEFGVVVTDDDGRITRFLEKPSWGEIFSDTINTGIYVLEASVLDYMEVGRVYDFSRDIFGQMLRDEKRLFGHISSGYWTDIGSLEQYQRANYDALHGLAGVEIAGREVTPGIWVGENCTIDPSAHIVAPVVLGRGVRIAAGASVIGPASLGSGTIVESGARITRAIAWNDVYIGREAVLDDCIVADRNTIKERAQIGEATVIGRGSTIGSAAIVRPNLKLWPDKYVASGSIVSMSLIYGMKWPGSLFGSLGVSGLANYEITPEFTMKIGQAFGSALRAGQTVMTSRDEHPASRVMNRCVISGLLSVGINVADARSTPLPLARYAVGGTANGGVHTRVAPSDPASLLIELFDENGINISTVLERKIEGLFFREDFRRTGIDEVGNLEFPSRALESYSAAFLAALQPHAVAEAKFRIVVDYAFGNTATVLPRLLGAMHVDTIALNAYFDPERRRASSVDRTRHLGGLGEIVRSLHANLGLLVDNDGETFALVDERGRTVEGAQLLALLTLLVARHKVGARIAMPVTAPSALEIIAEQNGATIVRTRSDRRSLRALLDEVGGFDFAGGIGYEVLFPEFQAAFDGLYGSAKALELIALEGRPLGAIVDELPQWHVERCSVACPWERKGEVMRTLHDEATPQSVQVTDGLRFGRRDGWVLVLPDASEPTFNLYAEGSSDESARHHLREIEQRIGQLVSG